jgi:glycosyltransferase involved in cell wall biosynthesis
MSSEDKKLNVVLCANSSWYIYNFRKNTIKAFTEEGHQVFVVAPRDEYSKHFAGLGAEYYDFNLDPRGTNLFKEVMVIRALLFIYLRVMPNFVMNFTPKMNIYSTVASFFVGAKVVNNISGLGTVFTENTLFSKFVCLLYRVTQIFAIKVFFQNQYDMERFVGRKIVPQHKCEYLPGSGVDLERFVVTEAADDGVVRFIIVCRMLYEKGVGLLVEAAEYCQAKYGDGVEFRAVGFLDDKNQGAVSEEVMNDWVTNGFLIYQGALEDVRPEIAISDCMVLPSVYPEGTPKSLLEAAAMGKPIITNNMPGCSSVVEHGVNGLLCRPNSIDDLIISLERLIDMGHDARLEMGVKSRELVERKFDERIVIEKYLDCLGL